MGLLLPPGALERFIGTFQRVSATKPPPRPDFSPQEPLERLVVTHGMLQLVLGGQKVDVVIPEAQRSTLDTYRGFGNLLAQELVNLLQVPHMIAPVTEALQANGLVAQYEGPMLRINPLALSVGEADHF